MDPISESKERELLRHAQFQIQLQRWSEARSTLLQLATAAPHEARYRALLAFARGHEASLAGDQEKAATEWRRAIALDPTLDVAAVALRTRGRRKSWVDRLFGK
jgi:hypothetical protein